MSRAFSFPIISSSWPILWSSSSSGLSFARYIRQAKDYFAAGNIMPWWLAGTSFYKASFSALLFVIYNEIAYKYGIVAIIICGSPRSAFSSAAISPPTAGAGPG